MAHFIGTDSYHLLSCQIGQPVMSINESKIFLGLSIVNRIFGMCLLAYLISLGFDSEPLISDKLIIGIIGIVSGAAVLFSRAAQTDIVSRCLMRIRPWYAYLRF